MTHAMKPETTHAARLIKMAARLAALTATLGVLVATSPAAVCDKRLAPVVFRSQGTCGPEGLVVVSVDDFSGTISFGNVPVLGLPPNVRGESTDGACPMAVERGGREVRVTSCPGDAGVATDCPRTCTAAAVSSGPLQFVCVGVQGLPLCASTLMVAE
jgi:hypothetical protein